MKILIHKTVLDSCHKAKFILFYFNYVLKVLYARFINQTSQLPAASLGT